MKPIVEKDLLQKISDLRDELVHNGLDIYNFTDTNVTSLIQKKISVDNNIKEFYEIGKSSLSRESENNLLYIDLTCLENSAHDLEICTLITKLYSMPIRLLAQENYWQPLFTRTDIKSDLTHGIGSTAFHIDYISKQRPPRYIGFYSEISDPLGGGQTELSSFKRTINYLDGRHIDVLAQPVLRYRSHYSPYFGDTLERFSVIPKADEEEIYRYTGKMASLLDGTNNVIHDDFINMTEGLREAIISMEKTLNQEKVSFVLKPRQFVIFDQLKMAHNRAALGSGQDKVPKEDRRLIKQGYGMELSSNVSD